MPIHRPGVFARGLEIKGRTFICSKGATLLLPWEAGGTLAVKPVAARSLGQVPTALLNVIFYYPDTTIIPFRPFSRQLT